MSEDQLEYIRDHRLAKLIVCFLVILLLVLSQRYELLFLDIVAVVIWFFGVNPTQYFIESIKKHRHKINIC